MRPHIGAVLYTPTVCCGDRLGECCGEVGVEVKTYCYRRARRCSVGCVLGGGGRIVGGRMLVNGNVRISGGLSE